MYLELSRWDHVIKAVMAAQSTVVHGDPMFKVNGTGTHFWLREGQLTPLLTWGGDGDSEKVLLGKTFSHPDASINAQWFGEFAIMPNPNPSPSTLPRPRPRPRPRPTPTPTPTPTLTLTPTLTPPTLTLTLTLSLSPGPIPEPDPDPNQASSPSCPRGRRSSRLLRRSGAR